MTARWEAIQKLQVVMYDRRGVPVPRTPTELLEAVGFDALQERIAELEATLAEKAKYSAEYLRETDAHTEWLIAKLEAAETKLEQTVTDFESSDTQQVISGWMVRAEKAEARVAELTVERDRLLDAGETMRVRLEAELQGLNAEAEGFANENVALTDSLAKLEARVALAQRIIDAYADDTYIDNHPTALLDEWENGPKEVSE